MSCLAVLLVAGCGDKISDISVVQAPPAAADSTLPVVSVLSPANGASNVAADGAVFKIAFSETMDTSVNLNSQATLTASGFSISLQRSDTGNSLIVDASNALSYGTFAWMTSVVPNDTMAFTLKSSATLRAAGLKTLVSGKTYNITSRTIPSNLKDSSGNPVDSTGIASTGSFSTL